MACQFLCGTAAQFQGDERDVMFLTMVDSPGDGPLAKHDIDLYRQRFNVAASRPRDQLWVAHSLDPKRDLKPGDVRRRLIEHAENPRALLELQLADERTESEFERLVLRKLLDEGYRVTPQWPVGWYRIDLVVEGNGRRLAVECDGDRFHPLEKIAEDMERQAVLERLGWRFVRIRGSEFFRDQIGAMAPVFAKLAELDIVPCAGEMSPSETPSSDLLDRVKRRAGEILLQSQEEGTLLPLEGSSADLQPNA
jgi:very-short-patch-repair endonuclease